MKLTCFTLCTSNFLSNAIASISSIKNNTINNIDYYIFVLDASFNDSNINGIQLLCINQLDSQYQYYYNQLVKKYGNTSNETRWSLKSVVLHYLQTKYDKTIYIDPDIFFIDDINILYSKIDNNILLTPHFRSIEPQKFDTCNLTDGYFNAGFIASSNTTDCMSAMLWWFQCCLMNCKKQHIVGLHDDQKYLDLMYIHFAPLISKIDHRGCNIAHWNINNYDIHILDDQYRFLINNQYNPIFFHFSSCSHVKHKIFNYYYDIYKSLNEYYKHKLTNEKLYEQT